MDEDEEMLFVDLKPEYCCPIHLGFLKDPVISKCGHSFCKSCIQATLQSKFQCPIDRKYLTPNDLFPNLFAKNFIEELQIYCKYGVKKEKNSYTSERDDHGCKEILIFREREKHYQICPFAIISCDWCDIEIQRQLLQSHQQSCSHRPTPCTKCSAEIPHCEMKVHLRDSCPKVRVICSKCQFKMNRQDLLTIHNSECPMVTITCHLLDETNGEKCLHQCLRKELVEHQKSCMFAKVSCPNPSCPVILSERALDSHDRICKYKVVKCPNVECTHEVARHGMTSHRQECKFELIACEFGEVGCPVKLARCKLEAHVSENLLGHVRAMASDYKSLKQDNSRLQRALQSQKSVVAMLQERVIDLELLVQESSTRRRVINNSSFFDRSSSVGTYESGEEEDESGNKRERIEDLYEEVEEWERKRIRVNIDALE